jgi:AraC-like DNA-binding protein
MNEQEMPDVTTDWTHQLLDMMPGYVFQSLGQGAPKGTMKINNLGGMLTADIYSSPVSALWNPAGQSASDSHIKVIFQVEGVGGVAQCGRQAELSPGDFFLVDNSLPFELSCKGSFRHYSIELPKSLIAGSASALSNITAIRIDSGLGCARFLRNFVDSIISDSNPGDVAVASRLRSHAVDLLLTAVTHQTSIPVPIKESRFERARAFIMKNLTDPALNVQTVADALHMSERSLYNLFEREGLTVARLIREERLASCKRMLEDPACFSLPIGTIALDHGFNDSGYFSTAFHATYGFTPKSHRQKSMSALANA